MDGSQLKQQIVTSKQMIESQELEKSSKMKKDEIKEFKEESARFSKVRRMTNKD